MGNASSQAVLFDERTAASALVWPPRVNVEGLTVEQPQLYPAEHTRLLVVLKKRTP